MADPKEEEEGREGATIHLLPDHLLARCFLKVPKRFRRSVLPQTCKRWRKVASSASELWIHRDVALQGKPWQEEAEPNQNWVRLIQWHSQKAQAINSLAVKASGGGLPCLPALLACLGPDSLVNLEINLKDSAWSLHHRALLSLHCAALAAISCFRHLKKLVLRNWPGGINSIQADAIGSLTALEHLEINLHKELSWDPRRSWEDDGFFSDTDDEESDQEDEEFVGNLTRRFSKELGKLTRLHTLVLRGGWPNVPSLPQLTRLQRLEFCGESMFGLSPGITDLRELTTLTILNHGGSRNASVIRNLTGLTGLKALRIMDRAFPAAIGTLTGLTSLEMRIGRVPPDRIEEDFRLMLLRLHRLQRLHLEVMHMEMLPEALVQLDHLTELHLERCNLPGLPRGRYLQSLQVLSLAGNAMERLPAALATAAKLETLDVSEMELQLGRAGKKLLFEMPALKLVRAFAAPHVDAGAPLRLADELYRVNKMRQQQLPVCVPLEIQVSRNDSSSSSDDEGSQAFSAEDQGSDSDSNADSNFSNF